MRRQDPKSHLLSRVEIDEENGCWLWTGSLGTGGYARFCGQMAHRASYELFIGPIGEGLHVDHLCRVRHCVKPDHLEPVTQAENNRRAWQVRWAKEQVVADWWWVQMEHDVERIRQLELHNFIVEAAA